MLSLILQALYGAVDLVVVGHFGSVASVSAVATGSQIMHTATVLVTGLTMGVTVALGHSIGVGDKNKCGAIVAGQIKLFSVVAIVLTVTMIVFADKVAMLVNVPAEAFEKTVSYIRICSSGMIFITAYNGISGIFRGIGNSKPPFLFVLIACIINIVLDLVFVGILGMDSSGAALATIIAQASSVVFSVVYIRKLKLPFKITSKSFKVKGTVKTILKIGSPIALQDFFAILSFLIITSIVNILGVVASASIGIASKLFLFLALVPISLMSALSAFTAQNIGAKQPQRARETLSVALKISLCSGAAISLLAFFGGHLLARIFTTESNIIATTANYLKGCSLEYLFTAVLFCLLGYINGHGKTIFVMIQGLTSAFLVRIPLSYIFSNIPNTNMFIIGLAVPISAFVSLVMCWIYYLKIRNVSLLPPKAGAS